MTAAVAPGNLSSVVTIGEPPTLPPPRPAWSRLPHSRGHSSVAATTTRASVLHHPGPPHTSSLLLLLRVAWHRPAPCPTLCVKKVHRSTQTCVCRNPTELWHHNHNRYILITKIQQPLISCSCNTMLPLHSNDM